MVVVTIPNLFGGCFLLLLLLFSSLCCSFFYVSYLADEIVFTNLEMHVHNFMVSLLYACGCGKMDKNFFRFANELVNGLCIMLC